MESEIRFSGGQAGVVNVKAVHVVGADIVAIAPGGVGDGILGTHGGLVLVFEKMVG